MKRIFIITVLCLSVLLLMGFKKSSGNDTDKQKEYILQKVSEEKRIHQECIKQQKQITNTKKGKNTYQKPVTLNDISSVEYGKVYANIRCDDISLYTKVYFGDDGDIIEKGVGSYAGAGTPGNGKMMLLDSHNNTYFKPLKNIQNGDTVSMETYYGTYDYQVYQVTVFNEKDLEDYVIEHLNDNEEVLILYTCYPFQKTSYRKTERLVVFAK